MPCDGSSGECTSLTFIQPAQGRSDSPGFSPPALRWPVIPGRTISRWTHTRIWSSPSLATLLVQRGKFDQAKEATDVKQSKLRRGDLVFFKVDSRRVTHVGIYIGERRFVHAPGAGKPVTINSLDDEFYTLRFSSAGRFWNRLPE